VQARAGVRIGVGEHLETHGRSVAPRAVRVRVDRLNEVRGPLADKACASDGKARSGGGIRTSRHCLTENASL
jgi:hypothetical protein